MASTRISGRIASAVGGLAGGLAGSVVMVWVAKLLHSEPLPPLTPVAGRAAAQTGAAVPYGFAALSGAVYGSVKAGTRGTGLGAGIALGSLLWLLADETVLPIAGLTGPFSDWRRRDYAASALSHLSCGLTTEFLRRGVMRWLGGRR